MRRYTYVSMTGRETPTAMRYLDDEDVKLADRLRTRKRFFEDSPLSQVEIGSRDCDVTPFSFGDDDKENSPGCPFSPVYGFFLSSTEKFLKDEGLIPDKVANMIAFGDAYDPLLASLAVSPDAPKKRKAGTPIRRVRPKPLGPFEG